MLSSNEKLFNEFKSTSIQFQKGKLESQIYYQILINSFGKENSKQILPDLIETLPEKNKKLGEELKKIHSAAISSSNQNQSKKSNRKIKKNEPKSYIPSNTVKEDWPSFGETIKK